jgi:hypothetical protein
MIALVDGTIHRQDIRRSLGRPRNIPADRLERGTRPSAREPRLGAGRRITGLQLRATDIDWAHGHGPEITGPGEANGRLSRGPASSPDKGASLTIEPRAPRR